MQNNLLGWWNVSVCGQSNAAIFFLDWISLYILSGKHENPVVTHLTVACPLYTHCSYKQKGNEMVYTNTTVCPVDIVRCVPPMLLHDSVQVPNLESVSFTIENNCIRCNCTPPPLPPFLYSLQYWFPPLTTAPSENFYPFLQCSQLKKGVTGIFCIWALTSILGPCCEFLC